MKIEPTKQARAFNHRIAYDNGITKYYKCDNGTWSYTYDFNNKLNAYHKCYVGGGGNTVYTSVAVHKFGAPVNPFKDDAVIQLRPIYLTLGVVPRRVDGSEFAAGDVYGRVKYSLITTEIDLDSNAIPEGNANYFYAAENWCDDKGIDSYTMGQSDFVIETSCYEFPKTIDETVYGVKAEVVFWQYQNPASTSTTQYQCDATNTDVYVITNGIPQIKAISSISHSSNYAVITTAEPHGLRKQWQGYYWAYQPIGKVLRDSTVYQLTSWKREANYLFFTFDKPHNLRNGEWVQFFDVPQMSQLLYYSATVVDASTIKIASTGAAFASQTVTRGAMMHFGSINVQPSDYPAANQIKFYMSGSDQLTCKNGYITWM